MDLSTHPNLLSLGFLFNSNYDPAPWLFNVLDTVPLGCVLEVITLTIRQDACEKVEPAWSRIDQLLTDEAGPVCAKLVIKVAAQFTAEFDRFRRNAINPC